MTAIKSWTQRRNWSDLAASLSDLNINSQLLCQLNAGWGEDWKLKLAFSTSTLMCWVSLQKTFQWLNWRSCSTPLFHTFLGAGNLLLLWLATGAWTACLAPHLWHFVHSVPNILQVQKLLHNFFFSLVLQALLLFHIKYTWCLWVAVSIHEL